MLPAIFSLFDWAFKTRKRMLRALRPGSRSFPSHRDAGSFVAGAQAFRLADPRSRAERCPPELRAFAERWFGLLSSRALDLDLAAAALDAESREIASARSLGSLNPSSSGFLIQQERQRRSLALEREALCLLARACSDRLASRPSRPAEFLDAPQRLLNGRTLLSFFVGARDFDCCDLILELGADPEARDSDGSAPLALAEIKASALEGGAGAAEAAAGHARQIASLLQKHALARQPLSHSLTRGRSPRL